MTDQPPLSPFKLTGPRILILVLGVLAIVMIVGSLLGGVSNYQLLKEAAPSSASSAPSSQPSP